MILTVLRYGKERWAIGRYTSSIEDDTFVWNFSSYIEDIDWFDKKTKIVLFKTYQNAIDWGRHYAKIGEIPFEVGVQSHDIVNIKHIESLQSVIDSMKRQIENLHVQMEALKNNIAVRHTFPDPPSDNGFDYKRFEYLELD